MSTTDTLPEKVHLVGSIALDSVEEVFRATGKLLGRRLKRVPDGEPGGRRLWISWQYPLLRANGYLRAEPNLAPAGMFPKLRLADGVKSEEIRFGELGYAREARDSYLDFCAARERGRLPRTARFQVCMPTPMGVIWAFWTPPDLLPIYDAYEQAMIREVELICRSIPHRDLCIQWDFCHEMIIWDGQPQDMFPLLKASHAEIMERMRNICAPIPDDVELGFHLCYGDFGGKHFFDPIDAGKMVEVCNALAQAVKHKIAYIHLPVPLTRGDDAYFKPLADLKLDPGTELYLGLVHGADGAEGTRKRIAVAGHYVKDFGIATECGMARARTPEVVRKLLQVHADASREPAA